MFKIMISFPSRTEFIDVQAIPRIGENIEFMNNQWIVVRVIHKIPDCICDQYSITVYVE